MDVIEAICFHLRKFTVLWNGSGTGELFAFLKIRSLLRPSFRDLQRGAVPRGHRGFLASEMWWVWVKTPTGAVRNCAEEQSLSCSGDFSVALPKEVQDQFSRW